jgi:hypothetical protein
MMSPVSHTGLLLLTTGTGGTGFTSTLSVSVVLQPLYDAIMEKVPERVMSVLLINVSADAELNPAGPVQLNCAVTKLQSVFNTNLSPIHNGLFDVALGTGVGLTIT